MNTCSRLTVNDSKFCSHCKMLEYNWNNCLWLQTTENQGKRSAATIYYWPKHQAQSRTAALPAKVLEDRSEIAGHSDQHKQQHQKHATILATSETLTKRDTSLAADPMSKNPVEYSDKTGPIQQNHSPLGQQGIFQEVIWRHQSLGSEILSQWRNQMNKWSKGNRMQQLVN